MGRVWIPSTGEPDFMGFVLFQVVNQEFLPTGKKQGEIAPCHLPGECLGIAGAGYPGGGLKDALPHPAPRESKALDSTGAVSRGRQPTMSRKQETPPRFSKRAGAGFGPRAVGFSFLPR